MDRRRGRRHHKTNSVRNIHKARKHRDNKRNSPTRRPAARRPRERERLRGRLQHRPRLELPVQLPPSPAALPTELPSEPCERFAYLPPRAACPRSFHSGSGVKLRIQHCRFELSIPNRLLFSQTAFQIISCGRVQKISSRRAKGVLPGIQPCKTPFRCRSQVGLSRAIPSSPAPPDSGPCSSSPFRWPRWPGTSGRPPSWPPHRVAPRRPASLSADKGFRWDCR